LGKGKLAMSVTPKNGGHDRIMIYGPLKRTSFAIGSMSEVSARNALAQDRLSSGQGLSASFFCGGSISRGRSIRNRLLLPSQ
jgi:hypothetical protein